MITVAPADDGATIEVADTGVGIEPGELPQIFDRFYRGSLANEARGSGSGLGLAIVRSIVDMHHGSVEVSSTLGAGTRFTVILPADPRRDPAADEAPPLPRAAEEPAILPKVVDSSPSARPSLNGETSG
jgi:signal transduction histidine kinase